MDIHHHHVWAQVEGALETLGAVVRLARDLDAIVAREQELERVGVHGRVVDEQDADGVGTRAVEHGGGPFVACAAKGDRRAGQNLRADSKIPRNGEPLRPARRHISIDLAAVPSTGPATRAGVDAHALFERQYPLVLRFCRSKLRSREDAEDAAQTTFFYALGSLGQGTVPTTEAAWLLTIARNVCLNRWDATRRRSRVEVARDPHVLQEVAPGREDSDGQLIGLQDALGRLTEPQRRAILLREWQGLSYAEIATELDLSESAVETLLFRARRSLARELQGGRSLRDLGSLLGGLKSLLGGAGAAKVAVGVGVAAVVVVGIAAAPQLERTHAPPAVVPPAGTRIAKTEAPAATSSSLTGRDATPPARRGRRPASSSPAAATAPTAPTASAPAAAPSASSAPGPAANPTEPTPSAATPQPPANETTPPPADLPVPQLPSVEAPSLPSLPAVPPLPVTPPVSVPSVPALPTVDPPVVTVALQKLP